MYMLYYSTMCMWFLSICTGGWIVCRIQQYSEGALWELCGVGGPVSWGELIFA